VEEINIQKKIKSFRNSSIIHSIINLVLVSCHFIIYIKLFWISYNTKEVYYFLIFIILFLGIIPIFLAIFITFIKITKTIGIVIKFVLKYFILLEILISILSSISLSENEKELSSFVYSCPFLYEINDIDNIFEFYIQQKKDKIKENCSRRRCFINNYSFDLDQKYLCNFNYKIKRKYCSLFSKNDSNLSDKLMKYFDYCQNYVSFYTCPKRSTIDIKKKMNNYNYICPNEYEDILNIILIYTFLIADIVFLCSPWLIELSHIEEILSYLLPHRNNNIQNNSNLKETNNTSKEQNENQDENDNNFQRQPTQTIIIDKSENKINNDNNNIQKNILIINKNKNNSNQNDIRENIDKNEIEINKSKSEVELINNNRFDNFFKVINKNIEYKNDK